MPHHTVLVDTPNWYVSRRNTDWLYLKNLAHLNEYVPIQAAYASSLWNDITSSTAYLTKRFRLPLSLKYYENRSIRFRDLGPSEPLAIINHAVPPVLRPGLPPVLWRWEVVDPAMQRAAGRPEERIEAQYAYMGRLLDRAAKVFVASDAARERHVKRFPDHAAKFMTVPFFLPKIQQMEIDRVAEKHATGDTIRIAFVGGEGRRKGLDVLIAALDRLPQSMLDRLEVTVVSRKAEPPRPKQAKISFYREMPHTKVLSLLRNAHIFAGPARSESFGFALVEAMAAGCAVIGPAWETQREMFNHGEAGVNCAPTPDACYEALVGLLTNHQRRANIGIAAALRFRERYAAPVVAGLYLKAIGDAIAERSAALLGVNS